MMSTQQDGSSNILKTIPIVNKSGSAPTKIVTITTKVLTPTSGKKLITSNTSVSNFYRHAFGILTRI